MQISGISEFFETLKLELYKNIYDGLYENCAEMYQGIFDTLNQKIAESGNMIGQDIQGWNGGVFSIIRNVSDNVILPIGGLIILFIFCWEWIRMVQENNQMQIVKVDTIVMILLKFALCLLVLTKSFDIVLGLYSIGREAVTNLSGQTAGTFGVGMTLESVIPRTPATITFTMIIRLLGIMLVLGIARIIVAACAVCIYFQIMMWFMEMLIYASAASIPYATFYNKDWGQMGMNYTRKVLALGFRGFFMLLMMVIYGGIMNVNYSTDFTEMITFMCGGGIVLVFLIFKSGSIAESIFNAH